MQSTAYYADVDFQALSIHLMNIKIEIFVPSMKKKDLKE